MKKVSKISLFIAVSFFFMLFFYAVWNFRLISAPVINFIHNSVSLTELEADVTDAFKSNLLFQKDAFINLNGLYGRLSGRRLYNDVILMKNGMLAARTSGLRLKPETVSQKIGSLQTFNDFVSERGGHFVYVQFPAKYSSDNAMMPDGLSSEMYNETETFVKSVRESGIDVVDTLSLIAGTTEDLEKNYYATDHHWKPSAAFLAFREIMAHLREYFPENPFDEVVLEPDNWTVHEIPDQFLGSTGKRVGVYFTKPDALQWLTPDFETEMSFYIPKNKKFYYGNYEDVFIRPEYIKTGGDKLFTDHYLIYTGDNYPLTISKNISGYPEKILLIKDSYSIPLMTYLSAAFREVEVIDPRYYKEHSLAEYVELSDPDIVLLAVNSTGITNDNYFRFFGEDDEYLSETRELILEMNHNIIKNEESDNYSVLYGEFRNDRYYTVSIPKVLVTDGKAEGFSLALYDNKNKKFISENIMDINYCNTFRNCEWTFKTPDTGAKNLSLLLYAGIRGKTNSVGIEFEDVKLYKRSLAFGE